MDLACVYYKIEGMIKLNSENVNKFLKKNAASGFVLYINKNTTYVDFPDIVNIHFIVLSDKVSFNGFIKG